MASALQLDRRFRWCLYATIAILFVTGAAWLPADQLKETSSGEFWQTVTANLLMVHGGTAMTTLLLLGGLFSSHIARTWRTRLNRVCGSVMVFCNAILIVTAFGLYYLGSETLRPLISDVHIVVGLALPFLLALHIWLGRRRVRNALVPGWAKPPTA
jgi:sulfite exporter TauE/SafE